MNEAVDEFRIRPLREEAANYEFFGQNNMELHRDNKELCDTTEELLIESEEFSAEEKSHRDFEILHNEINTLKNEITALYKQKEDMQSKFKVDNKIWQQTFKLLIRHTNAEKVALEEQNKTLKEEVQLLRRRQGFNVLKEGLKMNEAVDEFHIRPETEEEAAIYEFFTQNMELHRDNKELCDTTEELHQKPEPFSRKKPPPLLIESEEFSAEKKSHRDFANLHNRINTLKTEIRALYKQKEDMQSKFKVENKIWQQTFKLLIRHTNAEKVALEEQNKTLKEEVQLLRRRQGFNVLKEGLKMNEAVDEFRIRPLREEAANYEFFGQNNMELHRDNKELCDTTEELHQKPEPFSREKPPLLIESEEFSAEKKSHRDFEILHNEINTLKDEITALYKQKEDMQSKLEVENKTLQQTFQLQIDHSNAKRVALEEQNDTLKEEVQSLRRSQGFNVLKEENLTLKEKVNAFQEMNTRLQIGILEIQESLQQEITKYELAIKVTQEQNVVEHNYYTLMQENECLSKHNMTLEQELQETKKRLLEEEGAKTEKNDALQEQVQAFKKVHQELKDYKSHCNIISRENMIVRQQKESLEQELQEVKLMSCNVEEVLKQKDKALQKQVQAVENFQQKLQVNEHNYNVELLTVREQNKVLEQELQETKKRMLEEEEANREKNEALQEQVKASENVQKQLTDYAISHNSSYIISRERQQRESLEQELQEAKKMLRVEKGLFAKRLKMNEAVDEFRIRPLREEAANYEFFGQNNMELHRDNKELCDTTEELLIESEEFSAEEKSHRDFEILHNEINTLKNEITALYKQKEDMQSKFKVDNKIWQQTFKLLIRHTNAEKVALEEQNKTLKEEVQLLRRRQGFNVLKEGLKMNEAVDEFHIRTETEEEAAIYEFFTQNMELHRDNKELCDTTEELHQKPEPFSRKKPPPLLIESEEFSAEKKSHRDFANLHNRINTLKTEIRALYKQKEDMQSKFKVENKIWQQTFKLLIRHTNAEKVALEEQNKTLKEEVQLLRRRQGFNVLKEGLKMNEAVDEFRIRPLREEAANYEFFGQNNMELHRDNKELCDTTEELHQKPEPFSREKPPLLIESEEFSAEKKSHRDFEILHNEINTLKDEITALYKQKEDMQSKLEVENKTLQQTFQLQIDHSNAKRVALEEQNDTLKEEVQSLRRSQGFNVLKEENLTLKEKVNAFQEMNTRLQIGILEIQESLQQEITKYELAIKVTQEQNVVEHNYYTLMQENECLSKHNMTLEQELQETKKRLLEEEGAKTEKNDALQEQVQAFKKVHQELKDYKSHCNIISRENMIVRQQKESLEQELQEVKLMSCNVEEVLKQKDKALQKQVQAVENFQQKLQVNEHNYNVELLTVREQNKVLEQELQETKKRMLEEEEANREKNEALQEQQVCAGSQGRAGLAWGSGQEEDSGQSGSSLAAAVL
uniref:trichohyalin-like n=1 Tax=Semicossyphus pulcher TaxID=241346 RepID=UPI0037E9951B